MSDENMVSLREYAEHLVEAAIERSNLRLEALQVAFDKAAQNLEKRLDGMNEFRAALSDQAARMATREQLTEQVAFLNARIQSLELSRANLAGKAAITSGLVALLVSLAAVMVTTLIKH